MGFIKIEIETSEELSDMLIAELSELGYDSFLYTDNGFEAAIVAEDYRFTSLKDILSKYSGLGPIVYNTSQVAKENWNKLWESNYDPIEIADKCIVRAPFHELSKSYDYDLIITPKMSFGTGHHQTTHLMLSQELEMDFTGKKVFDIGCGTGILAIMAIKRGATSTEACDVEDWAVENTKENAEVNSAPFQVGLGTFDKFAKGEYDILLANINKNVLLAEIPLYAEKLKTGGEILLSGFYVEDIEDLETAANAVGLQKLGSFNRDKWACLRMKKG